MTDQASHLLKDYQALAQQSWDAWNRYLQQHATTATPFGAVAGMGSAFGSGDDVMSRCMSALKGYSDWLQGAAGSGMGQVGVDWQQSLQSLFSSLGGQPFAQAFAGIDSEAAHGFAQQWQAWLQATQTSAMHVPFDIEHFAAFGYTREKQLQQQALAAAMQNYLEWSGKYQALIQKANAKGLERLQAKLAELTESKRQIESLKALYDLWVDGAEEAYAEIALSDEFRHVYGGMVNAQGRVRALQQQQLEAMSRELGMPTRSEMSALGKRLHELRREVRTGGSQAVSDDVAALRKEVAALKRQLASKGGEEKAAVKKPVARSSKRTSDSDVDVLRTKPAAAVVARKSVVRSTRTRK